jgi:hypothetical protein
VAKLEKMETITGKLVCISCALKKDEGAITDCKTFSCNYGLKTEDGKLWSVLKTAQSKKLLLEKNAGKTVEVSGKKYETAQYIEVKSFKIIEEKKELEQKPVETPEKAVYTCSMHPEVKSDKPGDCPKCGMKLIKK